MQLSDFYYDLPEELIAQDPLETRSDSRLMVINRESGEFEHKHFYNILDYVNQGDCLVINDTKVIPLEHIPENSGKKTLRGYFITEDMVFETPVSGDLNNITVGKYVDCNVDAATNIIGVTNYTGTFAMILNKDAAKSEQKVLVALKF